MAERAAETESGIGTPTPSRGRSVRRTDRSPSRRGFRARKKRVRRWLAARAIALAAIVLPRLYVWYMRLVWATSRHDDRLLTPLLRGCVARHGRAVAVLWHEEVFSVAFAYRHLRGHTLASVSDFGEVITGMLRLCNFVVFRGGSGSRSRRREVLPDLIDHMQTTPDVIYGLTVDGSNGPVYRVKPGCVTIAAACRAPIVVVRTWYTRAITLRTWDRSQIPLPFTRRITLATGPYWIAPDADEEEREVFRKHIENELLEMTVRAKSLTGEDAIPDGFPAGWRSRWAPDQLGAPHGPYDLDLDHPPPWAHVPRPAPE